MLKELAYWLYVITVAVIAYILLAKATRELSQWVPHVVLGLSLVGLFTVWAALSEHTPESAAMAEDFDAALREADIKPEKAALWMNVRPSHLSEMRAGKVALDMRRVALLPASFQIAFAKRRLQRFGGYTVLENGSVVDALNRLMAEAERVPLLWQQKVSA